MRKALLALTAALSFNAAANTYVEVDYTHIFENDVVLNEDFSQSALTARYGHNFSAEDAKLQNKIEAFVGLGLGDDEIFGTDLEVTHYYGVSYRPTIQLNNDWDVFGRLSYARLRAEAGNTHTSESELGFGIGVSYDAFSLSFDKFDDLKFVNLGYTFKF